MYTVLLTINFRNIKKKIFFNFTIANPNQLINFYVALYELLNNNQAN